MWFRNVERRILRLENVDYLVGLACFLYWGLNRDGPTWYAITKEFIQIRFVCKRM